MTAKRHIEMELITACAGSPFGADQRDILRRVLGEPIDWQRFLSLAEKHYVLPLVAESFSGELLDLIPEPVIRKISQQRRFLRFRAELFCDELVRLQGLLSERGLSVLHYKGPLCSDMFYGSPYRRTYFDLDFLVMRSELREVSQLLLDEGYQCNVSLDEEEREQFEKQQKEYAFVSGLICLEPHWSITANRFPLRIDYDGLWERAVRHELRDTGFLTFSPRDMLLILSVVGSKGRWKRLQMVCDVAQFYRTMDPEIVPAVLNDAQRLGCERMLLFASHLAGELLAAPVPGCIIDRIEEQRRVIDRLYRKVTAELFRSTPTAGVLGGTARYFSPLLFSMRERGRDKLHYLVQTTTTATPVHMRRFRLPRWAFPLYRVLVPLHDYVIAPTVHFARTKLGQRRA